MAPESASLTNAELAELLHKHLSLTVPALQEAAEGRPVQRRRPIASHKAPSLDTFVQQCGEHLSQEEAEEVAQAEVELGNYSTAGAQACRTIEYTACMHQR